MLFFYGTSTTTIGQYPLPDVVCAHCGQTNTLSVGVFSRYLHFFWIPLLPLGKNSVSHCAHCQQVLSANQMPQYYRAPVRAIEMPLRTPVSNYIVLALAGGLLVAMMLVATVSNLLHPERAAAAAAAAKQSTSDERAPRPDERPDERPRERPAPDVSTSASRAATEELLAAPRVGDLLVMRSLIDPHYTIMRLSRVVPDTVYYHIYGYRPQRLPLAGPFSAAEQDSLRASLDTLSQQGLFPRASLVALAQSDAHILTVMRP